MSLKPSTAFWGERNIIDRPPRIIEVEGAVFDPHPDSEIHAAIYRPDRHLVLESAHTRGPGTLLTPERVKPRKGTATKADALTYIYPGYVNKHYGHFLLSTFSRLWSQNLIDTGLPIIWHADMTIDLAFRLPWFRDIMGALRIDRKRFVAFPKPTKLGKVIIPCPAFIEQKVCFLEYAALGKRIGDALCGSVIRRSKPVYLSKAKVNGGVRTISNEVALETALTRRGFDIVHPEQMSMGQQIALWRSGVPIVSFTGSALHTALFSPGADVLHVDYDQFTNTSFWLINAANGTRADYVHFTDGSVPRIGENERWSCIHELKNPERTADVIAARVNARP
ncbi:MULTISPECIES: glycosyltransferase family 61 protein [Komagataeibacter]|uniref:glycosyltransferase family 61 protein n=1 Tax=Komagataeibacter TaxID=1434011 RepID=UPI0015E8D2C3|nr:glycosyltransferase 61 family protein [Komagataeibacter oboediens]GBR32274.1 capsular polysaccharide biosynthesis protein-like protein [Komagataeibacter oboediens DSM 11826]